LRRRLRRTDRGNGLRIIARVAAGARKDRTTAPAIEALIDIKVESCGHHRNDEDQLPPAVREAENQPVREQQKQHRRDRGRDQRDRALGNPGLLFGAGERGDCGA
jgi:hypothetical protein